MDSFGRVGKKTSTSLSGRTADEVFSFCRSSFQSVLRNENQSLKLASSLISQSGDKTCHGRPGNSGGEANPSFVNRPRPFAPGRPTVPSEWPDRQKPDSPRQEAEGAPERNSRRREFRLPPGR